MNSLFVKERGISVGLRCVGVVGSDEVGQVFCYGCFDIFQNDHLERCGMRKSRQSRRPDYLTRMLCRTEEGTRQV